MPKKQNGLNIEIYIKLFSSVEEKKVIYVRFVLLLYYKTYHWLSIKPKYRNLDLRCVFIA